MMVQLRKSTRGAILSGLMLAGVMGSGCWLADFPVTVDPGYYTDPAEAACPPDWKVTGAARVGTLTLDYSGGKAVVAAVHKRDVDVGEDGCLGRLEVTLTQAGGECPLRLVFTGDNGAFGGLVEAQLTADSECPGFPDAQEGLYTAASGFAPWSYQGPTAVTEHDVASSCLPSVRLAFPDRPFRLYRTSPSAAELTVNLQGLALQGNLLSQGQGAAHCFEASTCGPDWHDGGDGWCVGSGNCSPGYHLAADGRCL